MQRIRPTEALIDVGAAVENYRLAVELGGRPGIAIVKANAYGHGAVEISRVLCAAGAPMLGVALVGVANVVLFARKPTGGPTGGPAGGPNSETATTPAADRPEGAENGASSAAETRPAAASPEAASPSRR